MILYKVHHYIRLDFDSASSMSPTYRLNFAPPARLGRPPLKGQHNKWVYPLVVRINDKRTDPINLSKLHEFQHTIALPKLRLTA